MKLRFKGKINFPSYHGAVDFVDGEEKEVDEKTGEYLLSVFGDCFEEVKTRAIDEPIKHRMITTETKTKKITRRKPRK